VAPRKTATIKTNFATNKAGPDILTVDKASFHFLHASNK
jgi:hypothetical protein